MSSNFSESQNILIIGGGFGGVSAALTLARRRLHNARVTLVSDKSYFEYYPALHQILAAHSPREIRIPLAEIFNKKKDVSVVIERIVGVDVREKIAEGGSRTRYAFDYLILALGSETAYFDIPGLEEFSFGFKSVAEALQLRGHVREKFAESTHERMEEKTPTMHFVVVGGGPNGVELTGELAVYTHGLAKELDVDPSFITIDLIEAAPRLVPALPEHFARRIRLRLAALGVNIFLNRALVREEMENVFMKDMRMKTETVAWTAGIMSNCLYRTIEGLVSNDKGRVAVDKYLQARGLEGVFVVGDGADTPYSGMAQTAIRDGRCAAENIRRSISGRRMSIYKPRKPFYSIPVGSPWAATLMGPIAVYGRVGWLFRQLADLGFFLSLLSTRRALRVFRWKSERQFFSQL